VRSTFVLFLLCTDIKQIPTEMKVVQFKNPQLLIASWDVPPENMVSGYTVTVDDPSLSASTVITTSTPSVLVRVSDARIPNNITVTSNLCLGIDYTVQYTIGMANHMVLCCLFWNLGMM